MTITPKGSIINSYLLTILVVYVYVLYIMETVVSTAQAYSNKDL
jgi:hypothetical protein